MRVTSWVPLGLGAVAFTCGLVLLIDAVARQQQRTGRPSRLLGFGAVPAGVPVVGAGVGAAIVIAVATVSTVAALLLTGLIAMTTGLVIGRRSRR